jgi:hypothetical protein
MDRNCIPLAFATVLFVHSTMRAENPAQTEFFEKKIRPLLAVKCQACHNARLKTSGLDLSTAEGFAAGGQAGPLVAEKAEESRLLKAISYDEPLKMPPAGKLKPDEIASLTEWVKQGAPWPGAKGLAPAPARTPAREFTQDEKKFWAFQPMARPAPPAVKNETWVQTPIDRFILARLEEKGLAPAPRADRLTLLRRATFDLTGLPPTESEIRNFLDDPSPDAFQKVIGRLLDSPRYGERWGRHWLDVVRYADSTGNDEDHRYPYAWRYRDYVIDAFQRDVPYDQMIREQLAGDLLPPPEGKRIHGRGIVATGFLALGQKALAQQDKKKMLYDVYDEQIDVLGKAFLGLTLACARCHDHKFDPILNRDYYSLAAIFANTRNFEGNEMEKIVSRMVYRPLVPKEELEKYEANRAQIGKHVLAMEDVRARAYELKNKMEVPRIAAYMLAARRVYRGGLTPADAARAASLPQEMVQRWADYLQPRKETRQHLVDWYRATDDQAPEVAARYQERYRQKIEGWERGLAQWRQAVKTAVDKQKAPPARPAPETFEDPFFAEVAFNGGPFAWTAEEENAVLSPPFQEWLNKLRAEAAAAEAAALPEPPMADCVEEKNTPVEQHIFIRGDHNTEGAIVPKAFPRILAGADQPPITKGSGRLELANWLASAEHPLTARVMVNRVWLWHFGEGLVRTPDNFGKTGERPTHPELLDYLARKFVESGWSVKALHRAIMLSSAYQMASVAGDKTLEADPENRLLSRFNRRRLDVEEIRDGLLAISGNLDLAVGGTLQTGFGTDRENSNARLSLNPETVRRRTVYLPLRRSNLPSLLNLFDFGDATTPQGRRVSTNVAPQALFMLNSAFVAEQAETVARSLEMLPPDRRAREAYLRILNRPAAAPEIDAALTFVDRYNKRFPQAGVKAWQSFCRALMASNEFVYVD